MNVHLPEILKEACIHAHDPELQVDTPEGIVMTFLWKWGPRPSDSLPPYEVFWGHASDGHPRFSVEVFSCLQQALRDGEEEDRVFALFLLGALETLEVKQILSSYLDSPQRRERWASAITLGRFREEHVFPLLQSLLLEGFWPSEIFPHLEDLQKAQKLSYKFRELLDAKHELTKFTVTSDEFPSQYFSFDKEEEEEKAGEEEHREREDAIAELEKSTDFIPIWHIQAQLSTNKYEWYLHQRSECALVLGRWGNLDAVPTLRKALQAAYNLEQEWPDYTGDYEEGPEIWYFFEDRLLFALGQLGDTGLWSSLRLPADHLLVARTFWVFGMLQIQNEYIFWREFNQSIFDSSEVAQEMRVEQAKSGNIYPFVEPEHVKRVLAEYFGLSPAEQNEYVSSFPAAFHERRKERLSAISGG